MCNNRLNAQTDWAVKDMQSDVRNVAGLETITMFYML
jgi:hypothetical protein